MRRALITFAALAACSSPNMNVDAGSGGGAGGSGGGAGGSTGGSSAGGGVGGSGGGQTGGSGGSAGGSAQCPTGQAACDGGCRDVQSDPDNCGACGAPCTAPFHQCRQGVCGCVGGLSDCQGLCVDLQSDPGNCGMCGEGCSAPGSACVSGGCACSGGRGYCSGACIDIQSDWRNCGACGVTCVTQASCVRGACMCNGGHTTCPLADGGFYCNTLQDDVNNCGMCGRTCSYRCGQGQCIFPTCTDMTTNGTESDLDCGGACPGCANGRRCNSPDDCASRFCVDGTCNVGFVTPLCWTFSSLGSVGNGPVVVNDFNADGKLDVATNANNQLWLFFGNGDGTLGTPTTFTYGAGLGSSSIATGDFNNDGRNDIAFQLINGFSGTRPDINILYGQADAGFGAPVAIANTSNQRSVRAADVNRDGTLELLLTRATQVDVDTRAGDGGRNYVWLYSPVPIASGAASLAVFGDFSGDGELDLAIIDNNRLQISLRLDAGFGAPVAYALPGNGQDVATGDFDRDGRLDVAVVSNPNLIVFSGVGDGTFDAGRTYPVNVGTSMAVADWNRDGRMDVASPDVQFGQGPRLMLGTSDAGMFNAGVVGVNRGLNRFVGADMNGDGKVDIVGSNDLFVCVVLAR